MTDATPPQDDQTADASPTTDPTQPDFAPHNVLATFADMDTVRDVIAALEHRGVDGNKISLLGRRAEDAAEQTTRETGESDAEMSADAGRSAGIGAAAGAGVGGAVGFLAGAAAFGIPGVGPAIGAGIWATTLGGAAFGTGVGLLQGGIAGVKESEAWKLTYDSVREGKVVLGVHAEDEDLIATAEDVLRDHGGAGVSRFDVDGARRV
jgi:hypothetical protein